MHVPNVQLYSSARLNIFGYDPKIEPVHQTLLRISIKLQI